jgi:single-strand DNA-binding protein
MFNQINIIGNLTRDIELRYTQGGSAIASVGIASSHKFTSNGEKKEEVMFIDLTFFGKSAEIANQYLRKGSKVFVTGRLKLDQWVGQDGQKHSKHGVVVETMKMLDGKQDGQQTQPQTQQRPQPTYEYQNAQGRPTPPPQRQMPQQPPEIDIDEDIIPF